MTALFFLFFFKKGIDKSPLSWYNIITKEREEHSMTERKWIHFSTQTSNYSTAYYDDYYAEDDPKQIKRVWNDGYTEYYEED